MPRVDLTTMGELQLRLTVPVGSRLQRTDVLRVSSACSEANVAGTVSMLGLRSQLVSMTAKGPVGDRAMSEFRTAGVDLTNVMRPEGERVPLYFYEPAEHPIPAEVYFDRGHTPFRSARPDDFDWARILDTRAFFTTGITAALSDCTRTLVRHAFTEAHASGVRTAFDVNFRAKLWDPADEADFVASIAPHLDVLFCSHRDAATVFGLTGAPADTPQRLRDLLAVDTVVSTAGTEGCHAVVDGARHSVDVTPVRVLDRPGAGDAFVAAVLFAMLTDCDATRALSYGVAASRIALSHHGDLVPITVSDLDTSRGSDIVR